MEIELQEICDFIATIPPFDRLPSFALEKLTKIITIRYLRNGTSLPPNDIKQDRLYIIRKGAISVLSKTGKLLGKLGEGDICTAFCYLQKDERFNTLVDEDTLVYTIKCQVLEQTLHEYPDELAYFKKNASQRLNHAIAKLQDKNALASALMQTPITDIIHTPVITAASHISIRDAAIKMADNNVSSLVVLNDKQPVGILTDKDITKRCIAKDMSTATPIEEIMTADMSSVSTDTDAFKAMMLMTREQIRHLPVIDNHELKGIVSVTDFLRLEGQSSFYINNAIKKADSVGALEEISKILPQLQVQLVQTNTPSDHISKIFTTISSAITRKLITLAELDIGPIPAPFAWVAAGSHARYEQICHSDQNNTLVVSQLMNVNDEKWFQDLANFVCNGLARCGYSYCPWNVMASNPKWLLSERQWEQKFSYWITTPSPKNLQYSNIFFDLRTISGDKTLLHNIRKNMLSQSSKNQLFLAHLTANALKFLPPLGFFRDFVLVQDGKHKDTLDLKHHGLVPIIDLARIYSLAEGIDEVNTIDRIRQASGTRSISQEGADNLLDAFEFINTIRLRHQAQQISFGQPPDNFISPTELSRIERSHLKDSFKIIEDLQDYIGMRYKIS